MSEKINLLYLCTGNSCRSQMAEGWTRALKGDQIEAYSAGIKTQRLNPSAVKVMAEAGVDITSQKSQHIEEFKDTKIDVVITVCDHAHETCPWFPADCKVIHIGFQEPSTMAKEIMANGGSEEEQLDCYRTVRDEIKAFVETLPGSLNQDDREETMCAPVKQLGFFARVMEKLDKKLDEKSRSSGCCPDNDKKDGSSCC